MQNEPNRRQDAPAAAPTPDAPPTARPRRRGLRLLAAALLLPVVLVAGYALLRQSPSNGYALPLQEDELKLPPEMRAWAKPDLVLVVSGQMHGYVGPCGCSAPQYGGLVRRYNLVELLKRRGWPVVGVDLGELPPTGGLHQQAMLKYELSMRALDLMGYRAVGLGKHEVGMPLSDALIQYSANNPRPRPLAMNLTEAWEFNDPDDPGKKKAGIYHQLNARPWEVIDNVTPRVGVVSVIGPDLARTHEFKNEKLLPTAKALPQALKAFADQGVELGVLLYHEYPDVPGAGAGGQQPLQAIEAQRHQKAAMCVQFCDDQRKANPKVPPVSLVLSLTEEPEPPGRMMALKGTGAHLVEIGHKGRYVGVVAVYRGAAGLNLKYQLVSIGPEFDEGGAAAKAKNPIMGLMEEYSKQVKRENLLAKTPRTPHHTQIETPLKLKVESHYVGSETCRRCHKDAYKIWEKTKHAHAFETLVKKKDPPHREYDPECVTCHTVGYKNPTGYYDLPDAHKIKKANPAKFEELLKEHNKKLENVGCESCHGPASAHVANPDDESLYSLINPYRPSAALRKAMAAAAAGGAPAKAVAARLMAQRMQRIDDFCQKCHDIDNDVNWAKVPFQQKWEGGEFPIVHPMPRKGNQAAVQGDGK